MKKRLLAGLLTCVMLFSLLPATVLAEEFGGTDDSIEVEETVAETEGEGEDITTPEVPADNEEVPEVPGEEDTEPEESEGPVAQIGGTPYSTLDDAVAAAADGATIELLAYATTEGLNLSKDLTIQAAKDVETPTITFTKYGIALWGKALTLKNVNVVMNGINSTPYTAEWNWMTICASKNASLSLDNATMTMDNENDRTPHYDSKGNVSAYGQHAIYFCSNNKLNLTNGSVLTIKNYTQDALEWDGGDGGYNVNITNSTFISDHNRSGFTGTFYATITNSKVDVINSLGNGSNGSHFIITESDVDFSDNVDHGLSANKLYITNSTVTTDNNGRNGIVARDITIDPSSHVHVEGNTSNSGNVGAFRVMGSTGRCVINVGADVQIINNYMSGIQVDNAAGVMVMNAGVVTGNGRSDDNGYGGGVRTKGSFTMSEDVRMYNNHASDAGDDIYVYAGGSATFTDAQSDDGLILTVRCDAQDEIDGWYDDSANNRWEAHDKDNLHADKFAGFNAASGIASINGERALKAAHPYIAPPPVTPVWNVSKSKTATNLDKNFESRVTLSLPSAEEELVSDVVFVLDKSTSATVETQALTMLKNLEEQLKTTDAQIKVGVVIFNKQANVANNGEFFDLSTQYTDIEQAITQEIKSGTNMNAGLLAGKAMLDNDTSVDANRKYLIFVSDGISYMYDADAKITRYYWLNDNSPYYSQDPYAWKFKYGSNGAPADWNAWLNTVENIYNHEEPNELPYDERDSLSKETAIFADDLNGQYTTNVDRSLYKTWQVYTAAQNAGYHCYALGTGTSTAYSWGPSFMEYLAGGEEVSFASIRNDILYLLDSGSTVKDFIGYEADEYNFDFVHGESMTLTVGDASYTAKEIADNEYGFKPKDDGSYAYTVTYTKGDGKNGEFFVWTINEPITNFAQVQLTYTVKLVKPETEPGVYGQYDADGSKEYEGLYTNNSATLYPVDSTGNSNYTPEEFPKPTVSYTVGNTGTLTVTKYVIGENPDPKQEFSFEVTIGGQVQSFKLKNGETKTFTGLAGDAYEVVETDSGNYRPNYFDATGKITGASGGDTAVVVNVPNNTSALFISKTVKNSTTSEKFTFTVGFEGTVNGILRYTDSTEEKTFTKGDTVELSSGNSAVIYGLPAGVKYTVTETPVTNFTASSVTTGVAGTVANNVATGEIAGGEVKGVHYTNTYTKPSSPGGSTGGGGGGGGSTVLNTDDHYSYIIGYKDGYVRPYGTITRGEVATIFFRLLTDEARDKYWSQTNDYSDCNSELWCNNAISTLTNMGIIDGFTDGTFRPYGKITRAQFAKIAVGFFETTTKEYQGYYTDVPEDAWFTDYVEAASRVGLIQGFEDGTFRPNTNITRAQACVIVNRALGRKPDEDHLLSERQMITWPDNNPGDWYYADMQEATNSHDYTWLTKGTDKKYMEDWTKKLEQRDWAAFEHAWSTSHSAPGGEVVK